MCAQHAASMGRRVSPWTDSVRRDGWTVRQRVADVFLTRNTLRTRRKPGPLAAHVPASNSTGRAHHGNDGNSDGGSGGRERGRAGRIEQLRRSRVVSARCALRCGGGIDPVSHETDAVHPQASWASASMRRGGRVQRIRTHGPSTIATTRWTRQSWSRPTRTMSRTRLCGSASTQ
jgi:hypothetical protein